MGAQADERHTTRLLGKARHAEAGGSQWRARLRGLADIAPALAAGEAAALEAAAS